MCRIRKNINDHRIPTPEREFKIEIYHHCELIKEFYYETERELLKCYCHFSDVKNGTDCWTFRNGRDWDIEVGYVDEFEAWCEESMTVYEQVYDPFNFK